MTSVHDLMRVRTRIHDLGSVSKLVCGKLTSNYTFSILISRSKKLKNAVQNLIQFILWSFICYENEIPDFQLSENCIRFILGNIVLVQYFGGLIYTFGSNAGRNSGIYSYLTFGWAKDYMFEEGQQVTDDFLKGRIISFQLSMVTNVGDIKLNFYP